MISYAEFTQTTSQLFSTMTLTSFPQLLAGAAGGRGGAAESRRGGAMAPKTGGACEGATPGGGASKACGARKA